MKPSKYKSKWRVQSPPGYNGKEDRFAYYFETKAEAEKLCRSIDLWHAAKRGGVQGGILTESDLGWLHFLKNELSSMSDLPAIVAHWKKTAAMVGERVSATELCEQFFVLKENEGKAKNTLAEIRSKLKRFALKFGATPVLEISNVHLRDYLLTLPEGWTRKGHYKWIRAMFDFAVDQRMLSESPAATLKAPPRVFGEVEIYQPADLGCLLATADRAFPELMPWLAVSAFNFTRTCELAPVYSNDPVLQWEQMFVDNNLIEIKQDVAKQTRKDSGCKRFIPVQPSTMHWIEPHIKDTGSVMPLTTGQFERTRKKLFREAGVQPVSNGLRHSCLSYFIAANPEAGVAKAAAWAGNSEQVARSFYIESLTPDQGKAWFDIRRK